MGSVHRNSVLNVLQKPTLLVVGNGELNTLPICERTDALETAGLPDTPPNIVQRKGNGIAKPQVQSTLQEKPKQANALFATKGRLNLSMTTRIKLESSEDGYVAVATHILGGTRSGQS
jgi:hypothetical protein